MRTHCPEAGWRSQVPVLELDLGSPFFLATLAHSLVGEIYPHYCFSFFLKLFKKSTMSGYVCVFFFF